jgi:NifU-like protein involved in Fe-S cluster formation
VALAGYGEIALEHIRHPRNVGRLPDANAVGTIDDRATENLVTLYLRIEDGRVAAARFRTLGCSACIAASSVATELLGGAELAEARAIDAPALLAALGGLPADRQHCAELVARALRDALASYSER